MNATVIQTETPEVMPREESRVLVEYSATVEAPNGSQEFSSQLEKLAAALAIAQGEMRNATKDAANPFFKSKYADLASVWDSCRAPLSKNGLSVIQTTIQPDGDLIVVSTLLLHSSGQWIRSFLSARPVKNDPQAIGSCITYLRRYSLQSLVGIAAEDDDGNKASAVGSQDNPLPAPRGQKVQPPAVDAFDPKETVKNQITTTMAVACFSDDERKWATEQLTKKDISLNSLKIILQKAEEKTKLAAQDTPTPAPETETPITDADLPENLQDPLKGLREKIHLTLDNFTGKEKEKNYMVETASAAFGRRITLEQLDKDEEPELLNYVLDWIKKELEGRLQPKQAPREYQKPDPRDSMRPRRTGN